MVDGLERDFKGRLRVVRLDYGAADERAVSQSLGVRVHPAVVLVDGDGEVAERLIGQQTDGDLRPAVLALVGEP